MHKKVDEGKKYDIIIVQKYLVGDFMYAQRKNIYKKIEAERNTKIIAYATSDRQGMGTQIGSDVPDVLIEHLDRLGKTNVTGDELIDKLKWCSYIVDEPNRKESEDDEEGY